MNNLEALTRIRDGVQQRLDEISIGAFWDTAKEGYQLQHDICLEILDCVDDMLNKERPKPMSRKDILIKAQKCVCGQRRQDYGSPEDNFRMISELWTTYTGHNIRPLDVPVMMALLKIARIRTGSGQGTADCFIDIAGYAACGGEIATREESQCQ